MAIEVLQYFDQTGTELVHRIPETGYHGHQAGRQLIVQENQAAVFFRDGKALDTFGPGRHTLTTNNIPLLTRLLSIPFGGKSPFQASVLFVARHTFQDLKWGTKEPIAFRDTELRMVRLRAFGKYSMRIADPQLFVGSIVGTRGIVSSEAIGSFLRDIVVARLNDLLGENLKTIFDLPAYYDELAAGVKSRVADDFSKQGLELVDLIISAITPPEEVQKMIDERSGMGAIGDMNAYMQFKAAQSIQDAAKQEGGAAGQGHGSGAWNGFRADDGRRRWRSVTLRARGRPRLRPCRARSAAPKTRSAQSSAQTAGPHNRLLQPLPWNAPRATRKCKAQQNSARAAGRLLCLSRARIVRPRFSPDRNSVRAAEQRCNKPVKV